MGKELGNRGKEREKNRRRETKLGEEYFELIFPNPFLTFSGLYSLLHITLLV